MTEKKYSVYTRLGKNTLRRIDSLIKKRKFDNRSSFIRRAVNEYLDELEPQILT